jgi:hypothetical protein
MSTFLEFLTKDDKVFVIHISLTKKARSELYKYCNDRIHYRLN